MTFWSEIRSRFWHFGLKLGLDFDILVLNYIGIDFGLRLGSIDIELTFWIGVRLFRHVGVKLSCVDFVILIYKLGISLDILV